MATNVESAPGQFMHLRSRSQRLPVTPVLSTAQPWSGEACRDETLFERGRGNRKTEKGEEIGIRRRVMKWFG